MDRLEYFVRRALLVIPTFLGITILCFMITQFLPGGPVEQALAQMRGMGSGSAPATAVAQGAVSDTYRETMKAHYEFDKPMAVQYWHWLVRDRVGMQRKSYKFTNRTAWELIRQRIPVSLMFGLTGFLLSYLVCIPLGIAKAVRDATPFDLITSVMVFVAYAIPPLALGMVLKTLLCGNLPGFPDILPATGIRADDYALLSPAGKLIDVVRHMILPVFCYVIGNFAVLTILMKNSLLDQISSDYVRTVLAKGGSRHRAIWGHAVRNAMIPIATGLGSIMTVMFAGSVIIERIFEIPGMGRLSVDSVVTRDYPVFLGIIALTSILTLAGRIISDLCYVLIDPRIRFDGGR